MLDSVQHAPISRGRFWKSDSFELTFGTWSQCYVEFSWLHCWCDDPQSPSAHVISQYAEVDNVESGNDGTPGSGESMMPGSEWCECCWKHCQILQHLIPFGQLSRSLSSNLRGDFLCLLHLCAHLGDFFLAMRDCREYQIERMCGKFNQYTQSYAHLWACRTRFITRKLHTGTWNLCKHATQ